MKEKKEKRKRGGVENVNIYKRQGAEVTFRNSQDALTFNRSCRHRNSEEITLRMRC
jgi:hypothetical protein